MNTQTSGKIDAFLSFLRESGRLYHIAESDEQEANGETQDILHSLELEDHDYHEYARLSKQLKAIRQRRRTAKDMMAVLLPVLEWAEENHAVIKSLERLLGAVRKEEKNTEGRIYTPRCPRKDHGDSMSIDRKRGIGK